MKNGKPQSILFLAGLSILLLCCKKENRQLTREKPEKVLTETIGGTRIKQIRLYKDTVYLLNGLFRRVDGEELVIDAGTLIKATESSGTSIFIQKGAIIKASGTRDEPIVFTSAAPTGTQRNGSWGGIIIEGKSINNTTGAAGVIPGDSSGVFTYVRIEFANLVLRSIGSRTVLNHIQVSYSGGKASFKFDGGTFNANYLFSFASSAETDFYATNGCNGKMQYLLSYRHPYFASAPGGNLLTGMLIENNEFSNRSALPTTNPIISNATILAMGNLPEALKAYSDTSSRTAALITTGSTLFKIRNSVFAGFPAAVWYLDDSPTSAAINFMVAEATHSAFQSGTVRDFYLKPGSYLPFNSNNFRIFMLDTLFKNKLYSNIDELGIVDALSFSKPALQLKPGSLLLTGSDFSGNDFSNVFFQKVPYIGASGVDDWLLGWVNFEPLKTGYNPLK